MVPDAEVIRFIRREARLLDEKRLDEWYELFTDDAHYWVPAGHDQADPLNHNSLAYEDKLLLQLRIERLKSPLAYSQKPASRCLHVLQEPEIEITLSLFTPYAAYIAADSIAFCRSASSGWGLPWGGMVRSARASPTRDHRSRSRRADGASANRARLIPALGRLAP